MFPLKSYYSAENASMFNASSTLENFRWLPGLRTLEKFKILSDHSSRHFSAILSTFIFLKKNKKSPSPNDGGGVVI